MSFSQLNHIAQLDRLEQLTLSALSQHYDLDGAGVVLQVQQYEDNAVWRAVTHDDRSYVVRLSVRDGRPPHQQRSEMKWLESLTATGAVAVPGPVTTTAGDYVVPVEVPHHDEPCTLAVLTWLPGTPEPPFRENGIAHAMGTATARLHENSATVPLPDFDRPLWNASTILAEGHALSAPEARALLGPAGVATLQKIANRIPSDLDQDSPQDCGRIHGDLHRENLLALPQGGVGMIDFDDCGTGGYLLDIATVLSSIHRLCRNAPHAYQDFARNYLAGYTAVRPLSERFNDLLTPYLLLRDAFILNFVTAAIPVNDKVAQWGPGRVKGILTDMRKYLDGAPYPGSLIGSQ